MRYNVVVREYFFVVVEVRFTMTGEKRHNMSRRGFLALGAAATTALGFGILRTSSGTNHTEEELMETIYSGEDEPECEPPTLTLGEKLAHTACAIALSAVGDTDGKDVLAKNGTGGSTGDKYQFGSRYKNNIYSDGSWKASHVAMGTLGDKTCGCPFCDGYSALPLMGAPHAEAYIDFVMGKGRTKDGFVYVDPRDDIWEDREHGVVKAEYEDIVRHNMELLPYSYATFSCCGALPLAVHESFGLKHRPWWRLLSQTNRGVPTEEVLPSGSEEFEHYVVYRYDPTRPFAEQCKPGDMLVKSHGGDDAHWAMWVGNEIAKMYFPETYGNVCEAGAPETYAGITYWGMIGDHPPRSPEWYFICRPKDLDLEPLQDLPVFATEDDPGCEEPCNLTFGEKVAHVACAISMTAVGEQDYNAILDSLGIRGKEAGQFEWRGGHICNNTFTNPSWASQQDPYKMERWATYKGCAWAFDDQIPDPRIPRARAYIDFTMCKDVDPQYGVYIPESLIRSDDPAIQAQIYKNWHNIAFVNGVPCYGRFCMCGTAVDHIYWALGSECNHKQAHGGNPRSSTPGNSWLSGTTSTGVPYISTGAPNYLFYFPDHMIGKGSGVTTAESQFVCYTANPEMTFEEQCEPGDCISYGPAWGAPEPPDFVKREHGMLYVGNEVVRQYFPNSDGIIGEAGGMRDAFWGIVGNTNARPRLGMLIYRPKDLDLEPRQWIPNIEGC